MADQVIARITYQYEQQLDNKDKQIADLQAQVANKDSLYKTAIKQLTEKGHEIADLHAKVARLRESLAKIVEFSSIIKNKGE